MSPTHGWPSTAMRPPRFSPALRSVKSPRPRPGSRLPSALARSWEAEREFEPKFDSKLYNLLRMARDLAVRLAADRPGELAGVVQALSNSGVNIDGLAEVEGVVHVLARDPSAARAALRAG